jgi:hypothetical protein
VPLALRRLLRRRSPIIGDDANATRPGVEPLQQLDPDDSQRPSSRKRPKDAGWNLTPAAGLPPVNQFNWGALRTLWAARNEKLISIRYFFRDVANDQRRQWVQALTGIGDAATPEALVPKLMLKPESPSAATSFFLVGDPGEGDRSQWCVVAPLLERDTVDDTHFMLIVSDVIYPAGSTDEYRDKFYGPYANYRKPIFAIPGNHDWDDGDLSGFGFHFFDFGTPGYKRPDGVIKATPLRKLWRGASDPSDDAVEYRATRDDTYSGRYRKRQPGPYFSIDTGPLLVVAIDTGFANRLDEQQGRWLAEVSELNKPKLLITGRPIWVNGECKKGTIEGDAVPDSVDAVVRDPANGYVAAIGGDTHNYQHYPVAVDLDGRTIHYVVSGGGGAFLSGTHEIEKVEVDQEDPYARIQEADVRFYPLRGHSLRYFNRAYRDKVRSSSFASVGGLLAAVGVAAIAGYLAVAGALLGRLSLSVGGLALGLAGLLMVGIALCAVWRLLRGNSLGQRVAGVAVALAVVPFLPVERLRPTVDSVLSALGVSWEAPPEGTALARSTGMLVTGVLAALLVAGFALVFQGSLRWKIAGLVALLLSVGSGVAIGLRADAGGSVARSMLWGVGAAVAGMAIVFLFVWISLWLTALVQLTDDEARNVEALNKEIGVKSMEQRPSLFQRLLGRLIRMLPSGRLLGGGYYPLVEGRDPPFFKSFLHVWADADHLVIRCWAATGAEKHVPEANTPLEDKIVIDLAEVRRRNGYPSPV